jgi:hypothetical protein
VLEILCLVHYPVKKLCSQVSSSTSRAPGPWIQVSNMQHPSRTGIAIARSHRHRGPPPFRPSPPVEAHAAARYTLHTSKAATLQHAALRFYNQSLLTRPPQSLSSQKKKSAPFSPFPKRLTTIYNLHRTFFSLICFSL